MTSFSNIGRGLGAGLIGLGILTTLSVGGCGDGGDNNAIHLDNQNFVDVQEPVRELTRVVYEFTRQRLVIPNSAAVAFYNIKLLDATGATVQAQQFAAADSVQLVVFNEDVPKVASTTVDLVGSDGGLLGQFATSLTLVKGQQSLVSSAPLFEAVLTRLRITTLDELGAASIEKTGTLQVLNGIAYPLQTLATYNVNGKTATTNITNTFVTYTSSNTNVAQILEKQFLVQGPTAGFNDKATITTQYKNVTGTLGVNITGLAAPSPTPVPSPSVLPSPTASPSASPSPTAGASPSTSPTPFSSPSPTGSPVVSPTPLLISPTPTPLPSTIPAGSP